MSRFDVSGRTALVTGAGSGIGRATALALAKRGADLALLDVSASRLAETADALSGLGRRVSRHVVDLADRDAIRTVPAAVQAEHGRLDILVNNAGVALGGTFETVSEEDFDWLLAVNLQGVIRMTRACLPMLKAAGEAQIVTISSIFGIIAPPGQTAYCASKFGVRGFSNALHAELEGTGVQVTVVHPGGVATRIAEDAKQPASATNAEIATRLAVAREKLTMDPAKAGEAIARAIEARRRRLILGSDAQLVAFFERLFPVTHLSKLAFLLGKRGAL